MLSETDIHYLVGLLSLVSNPDSVEIMLGDTVRDTTVGKDRDVDITITYRDSNGLKSVFSGIEVKKHSRPLDIIQVEQLSIKLNDMHDINQRAIVSASGYTQPVIKKAQAHGVDLFNLIPWNNPMNGFEHVQFPPDFYIKCNGEKLHRDFKVLIKEGESKPYVGCAIAELPNGNIIGLTVSQFDRSIKCVNIPISDRNRKKIYLHKLK